MTCWKRGVVAGASALLALGFAEASAQVQINGAEERGAPGISASTVDSAEAAAERDNERTREDVGLGGAVKQPPARQAIGKPAH